MIQPIRNFAEPVHESLHRRGNGHSGNGNGNGNGNGHAKPRSPRSAVPTLRADGFGAMVGASPVMRKLYDAIVRVAPTDATVLVIGESGTGKELVAQTIHQLSRRAVGPLIAVNCGAIPETLIESELFGHEKGAFTGATQVRKGVFERAEGGTLLLDEISEMPPELQVKLLRVLETERFTRIGGEAEHPTQVRVVAATNCEPAEAVAAGKLREDLLYRLSVFPMRVPPLRDRGDDIALLARHFLTVVHEADGTGDGAHDIEALVERFCGRGHAWPGNVRELKNLVWRSCIMGDAAADVGLLSPPQTAKPSGATHDDGGEVIGITVGTALAHAERQIIYATLRHLGDNKKRTAQALGISLKTLYNRLNAYEQAARAAAAPEDGEAQ